MQITQIEKTQYIFPIIINYEDVKQKLKLNYDNFKNNKIDADTYCSQLLRLLKIINIPTNQKYLSTIEYVPYICNSYLGLYNDKKTTLTRYYRDMINDSLKLIRHGEVAYLYKEEQIKDILTFHPNISLTYADGAFCVSLN